MRLNLKKKLIAGFIIALIPLLLLMWFSYTRIQRLSEATKKLSVAMEDLELVNHLTIDLVAIQMPANDYLIHGNAEEKENHELLSAGVDADLKKMAQRGFASEKEKEIYEQVKPRFDTFQIFAQRIFKLKNPIGNKEGAKWMEEADAISEEMGTMMSSFYQIVTLKVKESRESAEEIRSRTLQFLLIGGVGCLLFSLLFSFLFSGTIAGRVRRLSMMAHKVGAGDLEQRIEIKTQDEIGDLAKNFNKMTEALQQSYGEIVSAKDYADNIIRTTLHPLFVTDLKGIITRVNQYTLDLLGYIEEELIGKPVGVILAEEEEEEEEEEALFKGTRLEKLIKEGSVRDYDMTYRTKGGESIPMSFSGSVMRDKEGNLVCIVGIAKDMRETFKAMQKEKELAAAAAAAAAAEKKRAGELEETNKKLQQTQAMLVQAGKLTAMGQLGAGIAHELNQPLAAIRGYTQVVMEEISEEDPHRKDLQKIEEQTTRMGKIIDNVRSFARDSKGEMEPIDIHKPIEDALMLMTAQLRNHNIEVMKDYGARGREAEKQEAENSEKTHDARRITHDDFPKVMGDSNHLQQVFTNLLTNARDAVAEGGKEGRIWITTRIASCVMRDASGGKTQYAGRNTQDDQNFIEILVKNSGPPIPDDVITKIFDPFFTTKEIGKGTGLGLSISYGIIKDHKGEIEVKNLEDGVEFRIVLPQEKKPMKRKLNILVVDDDEVIRDLFVRMVKGPAYEIDGADSGLQAMYMAGKKRYDVAFIDMRMPGMDGLEVFRQLKKIHPKLTAVIITGFSDEARIQEALNEGAVACMKKPFDVGRIREVIRENMAHGTNGPIHVLAVDDEEAIRRLFERIADPQGPAMRVAGSAEEALALLCNTQSAQRFDVAFIDIVLPGMDGFLLCDKVNALSPQTKVILFTGYADKEAAMQAKVGQGAFLALKKPFDVKTVREMLERIEAERQEND